MVNNMTKKTAKAILHVYKHDMAEKLNGNDIAKNKLITLLNNVVQISYQRAISAAQMRQALGEAFDYIASYLKEQCEGTKFIFTYAQDDNDPNVIRCRYGLVDDNLPFSVDSEKAFNKHRG